MDTEDLEFFDSLSHGRRPYHDEHMTFSCSHIFRLFFVVLDLSKYLPSFADSNFL